MNNLHLIVSEQFPQFVRSDYPVFVEFVKAYYRWLDTQSVGKYGTLVDIDSTAAAFVKFFRRQLDVFGLTTDAVPFDTKYLKNIKEIYASKGSEEALIYLLRVVKGAETTIKYPSQQILRASDGRWSQEQFITVRTTYGTIPATITEFFVVYQFNTQRIEVTRFEVVDSITVRLYYKHSVDIAAVPGLIIQCRNAAGNVVYAASLIRSPSSITVKNGGTNWTLGQAIVVPGTTKNTIARVAAVDANGAIQRVEIIEYGFDHSEYQTLIVSPYPIKPLGSVYDLSSEIIGVDPISYHYTLTIGDFTDGTTEVITGIASGTFAGSYFLENYVSPDDYTGDIVFEVATTDAPTEESGDSSLTIEQWLASRATLILEYADKVSLKGRWTDDRGQISNENIRLQDNFYYQQYSYVIDSTASPASYIDLAKNIHPAGMKLFTNYSMTTDLTIDVTAQTTLPYRTIDLIDVASAIDTITEKNVTKPLASSLLPISDAVLADVNKYLTDSATADSSDLSTSSSIKYDSEVYFAEGYTITDITLNLGV